MTHRNSHKLFAFVQVVDICRKTPDHQKLNFYGDRFLVYFSGVSNGFAGGSINRIIFRFIFTFLNFSTLFANTYLFNRSNKNLINRYWQFLENSSRHFSEIFPRFQFFDSWARPFYLKVYPSGQGLKIQALTLHIIYHSLLIYKSVGQQHSKDVTNIEIQSPTSSSWGPQLVTNSVTSIQSPKSWCHQHQGHLTGVR